MRVAILSSPPDLSAYVAEIFKTWGLALFDVVEPNAVADLDPSSTSVAVCPTSESVGRCEDALVSYARQGGTVVCFLPEGKLAKTAGLEMEGEKPVPLRLRLTEYPASGVAGEVLPITGRAATCRAEADVRGLGYLSTPGQYYGESVGVAERAMGDGSIVAFAFDLPLCVLLLRQGDPELAEKWPREDAPRPGHLAADIGAGDFGWIPFADLLSRLLVDIVRRHLPGPVPLVSHLPGDAPAILLYSGDEDTAEVAWNDDELTYLTDAGARMNLYIIPIRTHSTVEDVQRYAANHDIGPHPDLCAIRDHPVPERIAEYERQIRLFTEMFGLPVRSSRNHCIVWAGYLEPVEVLEKLGVRMDANYVCGSHYRDRDRAPYASFGAAMPMRFCRPDGRIIDVIQQHTHLSDDEVFSPVADYSYRFSPEMWEVILNRIFTDMVTRFHTPYGVVIHPSNWAKFSRPQGEALLRQAGEWEMPIWSYDQWGEFWDARDTWHISGVKWDGSEMRFTAGGEATRNDLAIQVPRRYGGAVMSRVLLNGKEMTCQPVRRYREPVVLVPVGTDTAQCKVVVRYE